MIALYFAFLTYHTPEKETAKSASLPEPGEPYVVTAYSLGDGHTPSHGITASGERVVDGVTAACSKEIPFGTRVQIDGVGERICQDRGAWVRGKHIDVYMADVGDAVKFGRRTLNVTIISEDTN